MAESPTRTIRATVRRYEPGIELGSGSTATVWRARDTTTGRDVALKRFHPHLVADPVARQRIEDEAAAASRVSHPNIVAAADTIEDGDGLALVFPYVAGETLAKRMARKPRLDAQQSARIALDIADALAAAHAQGVVHRDVKPGNILLGTDGRARLLDFGIAHAIDAGQAAHDLTGVGMTIGTLPYMAPEQLAADPTTPASDVYALGVVLYEMLAGKRPYAAASAVALSREQVQPPRRIKNAPEPLVDLALAAMTSDVAARPDAAQLARGLSAWRAGRGDADAQTAVVAAAPADTVSRRSMPIAVAVGIGALLAVAVVTLAALGPGSGDAEPSLPAVAVVTQSPAPTATAPPAVSGTNTATVTPATNSEPKPHTNSPGGDHQDKKHDKKKDHKHKPGH
jgi:eukaryotic-like serine/threonine-protein kinase